MADSLREGFIWECSEGHATAMSRGSLIASNSDDDATVEFAATQHRIMLLDSGGCPICDEWEGGTVS